MHICLCDTMRERLREKYPQVRQVIVCSNAAFAGPMLSTSSHPVNPDTTLVLGHLGNLMLEKGLQEVIALYRAGRQVGLDLTLHLAGPFTSLETERIVREASAKLGDSLRWQGEFADEGRDAFFRTVDLFVLPSRYRHEAEPLVVLEALSAGVPVVAFRRGCLKTQVGDAGLLVDPDSDFVSSALPYLARFATDSAFRESQRAAATSLAASHSRTAHVAAESLIEVLLSTT